MYVKGKNVSIYLFLCYTTYKLYFGAKSSERRFNMKKSNILIFVLVILAIVAIFGFAIWQAKQEQEFKKVETDNTNIFNQEEKNVIQNEKITNEIQTNTITESNAVNYSYIGQWYISQEAYTNGELIEELLDRKEDNLITAEQFEQELNSLKNDNIVELDVDQYSQNKIKFDFDITSPAPLQREAKLDDIIVELTENVGTFTYTDNWGTSGNGAITLKENQIELKLETTKAAQGALWGVEGIYTFSYRIAD